MEFFSGINWTLFGVAVAVALSCWGSAVGVGTSGQAAAGFLSEKPALSTKLIIMQLLPGSQGIYGLIVGFIILGQTGILGGQLADISVTKGLLYFASALPIGIGGLFSAIHQGKSAAANIALCGKNEKMFAKAMMSVTFVELYALFPLVTSILSAVLVSNLNV